MMRNIKILGLTVTLIIVFSTMLLSQDIASSRLRRELTQPLQTVFVKEHKNNHLGSGVAISPDGRLLIYIGDDNGLYLRSMGSEQEHLLLNEAGPGLDAFSNPAFSSDGTQVFFSAGGETRYYPSNIYSIRIDGSGLKRLTQAKELPPQENGGDDQPIYAQYFGSAQPAPDGAKLLLYLYNSVQGTGEVALMDPDGSHLEIVSQGIPLFWSSDARAVYYTQDDIVKRFDLSTRQSLTITGLRERILGKLPDGEIFGIDNGKDVSLDSVQNESATPLMRWNLPRVKFTDREDKNTGVRTTDQLTLTSFQWSKSGRILLVYEGEATERFEVVEPLKR